MTTYFVRGPKLTIPSLGPGVLDVTSHGVIPSPFLLALLLNKEVPSKRRAGEWMTDLRPITLIFDAVGDLKCLHFDRARDKFGTDSISGKVY
ncbi:hypothetical protein NPIL_562801 [Nephila pilipes]|uniref:Uncharacterized protein n=1 Tax=Nephila pilipes TaxID=299642 RepID=A0A8X6UP52_NEPPI|nr:hypothetical protein NPIL_562801 [Nephila pilipes]